MNIIEATLRPDYEAMYKKVRDEMNRTTEEYRAKLSQLTEENKVLQASNKFLEEQVSKLCTERAELFSKVEIYEFCVRAFTGMGEKSHE